MSRARKPMLARKGVVVALSLLGLLLVALIVCEVIGWRFLRGPVERKLAETLGVEVSIGQPFELHLLRPPQLGVGSLRIGAPAASQAPFLVDARDALLQWRWSDLWAYKNGAPLRIKGLEAGQIEAHVKRLDANTASWKFGSSEPSKTPTPMPRFDLLRLKQAQVHVDDRPTEVVLEVQVRLNERARADGSPDTPWRYARLEAPYDDASLIGGDASPALFDGREPVRNALMTVAAVESTGFNLDAEGTYRKMPVTALLRAPALMPLLAQEEGVAATPLMVTARASVGRARMSYVGASVDLSGRGLAGDFTLSGPSLAAVGEPLGVTLPSTGPFAMQGHLNRPDGTWHAKINEATIGRSKLAGDFTYDAKTTVPRLTGQLSGSRLALADLGPTVGVPASTVTPVVGKPAKTTNGAKASKAAKTVDNATDDAADKSADKATVKRVIPEKTFDLPSLRAMNADVRVDLDELDLNTSALETLRPLKARILLQDGVLHLDDIDARTAGGSVAGNTSLDATVNPAKWQADLQWQGIDLAGWLAGARKQDSDVTSTSSAGKLKRERQQAKTGKAPVTAYLTGELRGSMKLVGYGNSTAQILGTANGQIGASIRDGTISHLAVEAVGLDVAQALGVFVKGDDSLPLSCAVVAFDAKQGVLKPRVAVFDTADSTLAIDGSINLASEELDLRGVVHPKDFTLVSLRTPVKVKGHFASPSVSLQAGPLAARVAGAAALALINPVAALLPFLDPGDGAGSDSGCRKLSELSASALAKAQK